VIDALIDAEAGEAEPIIERAFAAPRVDRSIVGNWDDVQVALGLKEPEGGEWVDGDPEPFGAGPAFPIEPGRRVAPQRQSTHMSTAKAKRKLAQASYRRNRQR
jgi:hypothetical protein